MKNKKAQFYFLAVIIIASIVIGIVAISNTVSSQINPRLDYEKVEIEQERGWVLDYLAHEQINDAESINVLKEFSTNYVNKLGRDKDIIFMIAKGTSLTVTGYKLSSSDFTINYGSTSSLTTDGSFEESFTLSSSSITLSTDGQSYSFDVQEGQNFFYFIRYKYSDELYIIMG